MPWKQWAFMERVTSADFQSFIQNQTIPQFTNAAQRDALYTPVPPPTGAMCMTQNDMTVWLWNGTAWVSASGARIYANQSLGGGAVGATELALATITVPAQPRACQVDLSVWHTYMNDTSLDTFSMRLRNGTTVAGSLIAQTSQRINGGNMSFTLHIPTAGPLALAANLAASYTVTVQRTAGAGTISPVAGQQGSFRAAVYLS